MTTDNFTPRSSTYVNFQAEAGIRSNGLQTLEADTPETAAGTDHEVSRNTTVDPYRSRVRGGEFFGAILS